MQQILLRHFLLSLAVAFFLHSHCWAAGFSYVNPPADRRFGHTASLLQNGKVLIAGGESLNSAELFDPTTNTWSAASHFVTARAHHSATILQSGKVLIVGGVGTNSLPLNAELYDPLSNTWSSAGNITTGRQHHTATLLQNGKVLVTGGGPSSAGAVFTSTELYDPATNSWTLSGSLSDGRQYHTATLLQNGKVLAVGGASPGGSGTVTGSELYDPSSDTWSYAGASPRAFHTATLLQNGKVLVAGGQHNFNYLSSTAIYDPSTDAWNAAANFITARQLHAAVLLPSGKVLLAGGYNGSLVKSGELYDSTNNAWSDVSNGPGESLPTGTLLQNGKVLIVGDGVSALYDSGTSTTTAANATVVFSASMQNVSLNAVVTSSGGTVNEGIVTFQLKNGTTNIGNAIASPTLTTGTASVTYLLPASLDVGTYTINAAYSGSANFESSSDNTKTLTVVPISPVLQSISPPSVVAGGPSFILTLTGTNFLSNSVVKWEGQNDITTLASQTATQITVSVPANYILSPGTPNISVFNPGAGGGNSLPRTLTIGALAQSTTVASNAAVVYNQSSQNVTLNAAVASQSGQVSEGTVTFQVLKGTTNVGSAQTSSTVSIGNASVSYPLPVGLAVDTYTIEAVYSGSANFAISSDNTKKLTVSAQSTLADIIPKDITLTPAIAAPGDTVTIKGSIANQGQTDAPASITQLRINQAAARPIPLTGVLTNVSMPAIAAGASAPLNTSVQIPADLASGTYFIWVIADNTSQVTQNDVNNDFANISIPIAAPNNVPSLQAISPSSITAGGVAFTMTLTGANFKTNSVVKWSGQTDLTTLKSQTATQITLDIPSSYVVSAGSVNIAVSNPGIGGGISAEHTFTISPQTPNRPPVIVSGPTATPAQATINQPVAFAVSATDTDGDILTYSWDFGDSTTGVGGNVLHSYAVAGVYNLVVDVFDGKNGHAIGNLTIFVEDSASTLDGLVLKDLTTGTNVKPNGSIRLNPDSTFPQLTASFISKDTALADHDVSFQLTINYPRIGKLKPSEFKIPKKGLKTLKSGEVWNITTDAYSGIYGGHAVLSYKIEDIKGKIGVLKFDILGTNPERASVDAYIDSITNDAEERKMLKVIIFHESCGYEQFSTGSDCETRSTNPIIGFPLISSDGVGAGLGQITSGVTFRDHWDWQYNVQSELRIFREKVVASRKLGLLGRRADIPDFTVEQDRINIYQLYNGGNAFKSDKMNKTWVQTTNIVNASGKEILAQKTRLLIPAIYGPARYKDELIRFGTPVIKPLEVKPVKAQ